MTKEITKAFILQQIQDKFRLRELEPEVFQFSEVVIPTYNIEQHLETVVRQYSVTSITSTGAVTCFTVPDDEQWLLHRYNVIFATGVYTIAGVMVLRPDAAHFTYLDLAPAIAVSYVHELPKDVKLNSGDGIGVNVDGYTSTGNLQVIAEVTKEEIR